MNKERMEFLDFLRANKHKMKGAIVKNKDRGDTGTIYNAIPHIEENRAFFMIRFTMDDGWEYDDIKELEELEIIQLPQSIPIMEFPCPQCGHMLMMAVKPK